MDCKHAEIKITPEGWKDITCLLDKRGHCHVSNPANCFRNELTEHQRDLQTGLNTLQVDKFDNALALLKACIRNDRFESYKDQWQRLTSTVESAVTLLEEVKDDQTETPRKKI